ncbi:MAG: hypothetical protein HDR04_14060 [Lachnospiraceae bacterium]|nr:hypothetical protein [Lachnospiraceae bacterium]
MADYEEIAVCMALYSERRVFKAIRLGESKGCMRQVVGQIAQNVPAVVGFVIWIF